MQGDDHTDVVERIKNELVARGVALAGACGAFEITRRVAWELRGEGAGLLSKPSGNNCQGFSVDYIVYRNGQGFDMLGDAGGANTPGWSDGGIDPSFPDRWRVPTDPGDVPAPGPTPTPTPPPPPPPDGYDGVLLLLVESLDRIVTAVDDIAGAAQRLNEQLAELDKNGLKLRLR